MRTGKNARLTLAQAIPKYNELQVLHVYGSPYEMGFAQGSILRDNIIACMDAFQVARGGRLGVGCRAGRPPPTCSHMLLRPQDYIDDMIAPYIKFLPKALQHAFEIGASQAALELEVLWTEKYVPKHFEDEVCWSGRVCHKHGVSNCVMPTRGGVPTVDKNHRSAAWPTASTAPSTRTRRFCASTCSRS